MKSRPPGTAAERLAAGLLAAFFVAFGWLTLLQGGISLKGRSGGVSYVTGGFGIAAACIAFFIAAMAALLLSRSLKLRRSGCVMLIAMVIVPPAAFLL
jgi:hypothetical protein